MKSMELEKVLYKFRSIPHMAFKKPDYLSNGLNLILAFTVNVFFQCGIYMSKA